jgi:hypothetical protein
LTSELEKRLDLDIERILESPKLELQLSPAELDKRLLDLYKAITEGPGGDLLRVIGGGNDVAFQTLYIKRNEAKKRKQGAIGRRSIVFGPFDRIDDNAQTASQWVTRALRRNLPRKSIPISSASVDDTQGASVHQRDEDKSKLKMSLRPVAGFAQNTMIRSTTGNRFCPPRQASAGKFTLLI